MSIKKTLLGGTGFKIQLFGGNDNVNLSDGEQAKYVNNIIRALGKPGVVPLEKYFAKSVATNAAYSVFYVGGKFKARDRENNINSTNKNYNDTKGIDTAGKFIQSIRVTPTEMETPIWVDDRAFDKSQLNEQSAIQEAQIDAIKMGCDERISKLFKAIQTDGKRDVKDVGDQTVSLTIPTSNKFGDKTKLFDTAQNIKAFRRMMVAAKRAAKNSNLQIGIIGGSDMVTELISTEKFTNKDWVTITGETPNQTGEPLGRLLGGNVEELFTYDNTFYPLGTETEGYIFVIIQNSIGQDNKKASIKPTIEYVKHKKAYFMDVEVANATELLNPEGVFVFEYKRDVSVG